MRTTKNGKNENVHNYDSQNLNHSNMIYIYTRRYGNPLKPTISTVFLMVFTMFLVYFALDKSSLDFEVIFKFCTLEGEDV